MVSTRFELEMDLPVLSAAERQRIVNRAQQLAVGRSRKEIATPSRRKFPRKTGALRKSFRGRRPRRRNVRTFYVALEFGYLFYGPFQRKAYMEFRDLLEDRGPEIIRDALAEAIRESI